MKNLRTCCLQGWSLCSFLAIALPVFVSAQDAATNKSALYFKSLPLEELMNVEVIIANRRPQRASEVATAIDVITAEQIQRSGATSIPDALRLATGLHVAQAGGHSWAITARGFNTTVGNKLQVLMDGRSLYSPLFSGVFWDVQNYLMDDIDRIEVIRGPGATMWGANAFNGVINIVTKSAKDTAGGLVTAGGGTEEQGFGGFRYGGKLGEKTWYRAYATYFNRDGLDFPSGADASDGLMLGQTGFRTDTDLNDVNSLTVQGDYYNGTYEMFNLPNGRIGGGNLLGRWTRDFGPESELVVQTYYDRTHRRENHSAEDLDTFDLDTQHRFPLGEIQSITWGLNYRLSMDRLDNRQPAVFQFQPPSRNMQLASIFVQDEISVIPDHLLATIGTKFEHNDFSGFEIQPSFRMAWLPVENQTLWMGVSRAVRSPARIETDWVVPTAGLVNQPRENYDSESVIANEIGYRIQPNKRVSYDFALFYNFYDSLRSIEGTPTGLVFSNEFEGEGYGAEVTQTYQLLPGWKVKAGYAFLQKHLHATAAHIPGAGPEAEGNDPEHIFTLHSSVNLPYDIQFDQVLRYVDDLPNPVVPSYFVLDLRLAWRPIDQLEFALVGRNLLDHRHPELGTPSPFRPEVERSVYGKVTWSF